MGFTVKAGRKKTKSLVEVDRELELGRISGETTGRGLADGRGKGV